MKQSQALHHWSHRCFAKLLETWYLSCPAESSYKKSKDHTEVSVSTVSPSRTRCKLLTNLCWSSRCFSCCCPMDNLFPQCDCGVFKTSSMEGCQKGYLADSSFILKAARIVGKIIICLSSNWLANLIPSPLGEMVALDPTKMVAMDSTISCLISCSKPWVSSIISQDHPNWELKLTVFLHTPSTLNTSL